MQYKIEWIEQKEYEGRKYAKAQITALDGQEYEVSLGDKWGDKLETIMAGHSIEGNVWQNPKNGKWSLYPIEDKKPRGGAYKAPQQAIKEAMAQKNESIGKFQDSKELSIKIASTMNKAVELAIATKDVTEDSMADNILFWRKWMWEHWDVDVKDFPPFN